MLFFDVCFWLSIFLYLCLRKEYIDNCVFVTDGCANVYCRWEIECSGDAKSWAY